jgi:hypothetical protein
MHPADEIPVSGFFWPRWQGIRPAGQALLVLAALLMMTWTGWALDIVTTDGHVYKDCTVTQVEPDALRVLYADGAARLPYEKLPVAVQAKYFDPAKVAAYHAQQEEVRRAAEAKAEEERRVRAEVEAQAEQQRQAEEAVRQREEADRQAAARGAEFARMAAEKAKAMKGWGLLGVGGVIFLFLYFLPTIIGARKANSAAIFVLNLLLGWTGLGWIVALVWACTQDSAMDILARERMNMRPDRSPPPGPPEAYPERPRLGGVQALRDREGRYLE